MAHVALWKKKKIEELTEMIRANSVIGIVAVDGVPGPQLQDMRRSLRKDSPIIVTKNNLLKLALKEMAKEKSGIEELENNLGQNQNALIVSKKNPFKLYSILKATESKAPAKGGETAPGDIVVKGGDTSFKPGPIVGELQKVGIPAAIMRGKVVIKKDKLLVKEGDKIPADVAGALTRLEIYPIMVGLRMKGAYEDGVVYHEDILSVDPGVYVNQLSQASAASFNLAFHMRYFAPQTIRPLVSKAHGDAFNLAFNAGVFTHETMPLFLSKAQGQMISLATRLSDGLDAELENIIQNRPPPSSGGGGDAAPEEEKKEEPEEEKVSEEDAAAGLGALFG